MIIAYISIILLGEFVEYVLRTSETSASAAHNLCSSIIICKFIY